MPKGVYAAASAMLTESRALEAVTANLANAQSAGYRRQIALRTGFDQVLAERGRQGGIAADGGAGVRDAGTTHAFDQGEFESTGNPLDLGLGGPGFFRVRDGERELLTRSGAFRLDEQRRIVNDHGWTLQGQAGDIAIPAETHSVRVDEGGRVYAEVLLPAGGVEHRFIDQIRIAEVADPHALGVVNGQYFLGAEDQPDQPTALVRQGHVERANVNSITELVDLIAIQRRYEAAQRALRQQNEAGRGFSDILRGA